MAAATVATEKELLVVCLASGEGSATPPSEFIFPSRAGGGESEESPPPARMDAATSAARRSATTTVLDGDVPSLLAPLASLTNESGLSRPLSLSGGLPPAFSKPSITPPTRPNLSLTPTSPSPFSFPCPLSCPYISVVVVGRVCNHAAPPLAVALATVGSATPSSAPPGLVSALAPVPHMALALLGLALQGLAALRLAALGLAAMWLAALGLAAMRVAALGLAALLGLAAMGLTALLGLAAMGLAALLGLAVALELPAIKLALTLRPA